MHITTVTIFELGIVLSVVGVIVTIMLALSGVNHESYFITNHRISRILSDIHDIIFKFNSYYCRDFDLYACG